MEQYRQEILYGILTFNRAWLGLYLSRSHRQATAFIYYELQRNPYSRRAVIDERLAADTKEGNTSPACLQHIQYFIRDQKLHCKYQCSNDAPRPL